MRFYQQLPLSREQPCFRLLELDLLGGGDELRGRVDTYDLKDPCDVDYDALSYCWGPPEVPEHVTLNDEKFPVSKNLLVALHQICADQQKAGTARKLWIDAICINQRDNAEKSHQVMLMRDIYANAKTVLAWIGEVDEFSPLAFDTLRRFSLDDGRLDGSATCRELREEMEERRAAIQRFIERPYFFRMWVVQEVVAAKKVIVFCGPLSIDFEAMCAAMRRITGSGFCPFSGAAANLTYVSYWRDAYHGLAISDDDELDLRLFLDTRDRCATDPRDKIFSLRGIAKERITAGIKVDYNDSVRKVYTDFSKHMLKIRPDLQILSAVMLRHKTNSVHELPSYVPDWARPKHGGGFLQRYYRFKPTHLFRASGGTKSRVTMDDGTDKISIEGLRLDTISRVISIKSLLTAGQDGRMTVTEAVLRELAADAISTETYRFTDEPAWVAYFRTLTADRTVLSPRIDDKYRSQFFVRFSDLDLQDSTKVPTNLPPSLWEEISEAVDTIVEDKDIFVTRKGYLGLGHEGFGVGATVCIFSGGEVPFLVRAAEDGEECRFLSECYVHGVMDGEAMGGRSTLEQFLLL